MAVKITCIKKDGGNHENAYTAITSMNWTNNGTNGTSTRIQMYDFVKGGGSAYVEDSKGNKAELVARETDEGTKYVKTKADSTTSDNLLKLPECK